jgi:polysaccharide biosynthesis transport protein
LAAIAMGIVGGAALATVAWVSAPTMFTASALIRISAENPNLLFKIDDTHSSFDIYKGTQIQLLTSELVLNSALGKVPKVETLKREEDPLRWLARSLQMDVPGNAEILRVSLSATDKNDAAAIVQAVVDSYMTEVVDKERLDRTHRLSELEHVYTEKETEMRSRRTELKKLTEQIGSGDAGTLSIKQQLATQQYGEKSSEFNRLRGELQRARASLAAKLSLIKTRPERPAELIDPDSAADLDPTCIRLQEELRNLEDQFRETKSVVKENSGMAKTLTVKYARMHQSLEDQLATRRQLLGRQKAIKTGEGGSLEAEAKELQAQVALLTEQYEQADKDLTTQRKQTELLGNSSIDVEMMRGEIQGLERVSTVIRDERQKLQVEQDTRPRIKLQQGATPPVAPDRSSRVQNTITAGIFGFLAPIGLLLWWDVRGRRINSIGDIATGLGLTVIGTVPHISDRQSAGSGAGKRRYRQMQICLDHSIDGIAAKLFLRHDARGARVVLVSSATRGEGKSTLSIQLAKRLALTGASTLLVDFDLRKPSLHNVFDAPRGPGLTEFLRGGSELAPLVRRTDLKNLSLLTAGSPFTDSLGTLSNGVTRSLFDKARGDYDFVIVDGSPILPVVDALLTSQHVDTVVLAVRRDISQAHRIKLACEQLSDFGVEEFVAVLTGTNEDFHAYYGDDEHVALVAEEKPLPR